MKSYLNSSSEVIFEQNFAFSNVERWFVEVGIIQHFDDVHMCARIIALKSRHQQMFQASTHTFLVECKTVILFWRTMHIQRSLTRVGLTLFYNYFRLKTKPSSNVINSSGLSVFDRIIWSLMWQSSHLGQNIKMYVLLKPRELVRTKVK